MRLLVAFFLFAALLFGCVQQQEVGPKADGSSISIPYSPIDYRAVYKVNSEGAELEKVVWRSGGRARLDLGDGNGGAFQFYFLSGKAYSCKRGDSQASCFDITGKLGQNEAAKLFALPDLSNAKATSSVQIGPATGKCYSLPYGTFGSREVCLTDKNVIAYDSYNVTYDSSRTEYLVELEYAVDEADFLLPAEPASAPD